MRRQILIPVFVGILALGAAQAFAQTATVVMRNGDRVQAEVLDMGADFTLRVNGQERSVQTNEVVLIDFAGNGRNISPDEIAKANEASGNGFVVMRNGDTFTARLTDIHAIPSKGMFTGGRDIELSQISRIYLGSVNNIPDIAANTSPSAAATSGVQSAAPNRSRTAVVPANVPWTNTGISVSRGQSLRFEPTGEIRLSFNGDDVATAAGVRSGRLSDKAIIPTIPVGALIGRVGNGQPFSIGETTEAFRMPANGRLFLGVNDDHSADNSGNYVVRVWEP
jgi:hypothetical protein